MEDRLGDADALLLLDRATQSVNRASDERVLRMVVVADSLVGPSAVEQLMQHEQLFEANRQHGRVPGEAAAGVLLCAPAMAQSLLPPALDGDAAVEAPREGRPKRARVVVARRPGTR